MWMAWLNALPGTLKRSERSPRPVWQMLEKRAEAQMQAVIAQVKIEMTSPGASRK
jgi:hypothetical protein